MAKINCCGDCTKCEHLRNGEVNPAECASIWGFMGVQKLHDNMGRMHNEIMEAVGGLSALIGAETKHPIPGIEFEPEQPAAGAEQGPTPVETESPAPSEGEPNATVL